MDLQEAQEGRLLWPQSLVSCVWVLSHFKHAPLFATPLDCSQASSSAMRFSRQEYWSGLPSPPLGDLSDPGIEPLSLTAPALQVDSLPLSHRGSCFVSCNTEQSALPLLRLQEMFI